MPAITLREDYRAEDVCAVAARAKDGKQARRLSSIAAFYDGMSRAEAARVGGMDRQTLGSTTKARRGCSTTRRCQGHRIERLALCTFGLG